MLGREGEMMETKDMIELLCSGNYMTSLERHEIAVQLKTIAERLRRQEAEIEKLVRDREWISVDDPPKENGKYLVSAADGLMVYSDRYEKQRKDFLTAGAEYWMPLPEPPKLTSKRNGSAVTEGFGFGASWMMP